MPLCQITLELLPSTRWHVKVGSLSGGGEVTSAPGVELEEVLSGIVAPMVERAATSTVLQSPQPSSVALSIEQLPPPAAEVKRRRIQILERLPKIIGEQRERAISLGEEDKRRRAAETEQSELQERLAGGGRHTWL
jgi:hypothetical protein